MFPKSPLFLNTIKNALVANYQQSRNTFILKRVHPAYLSKKNHGQKRFKTRNFYYELVEDTNLRPQKNISIILTENIKGVGHKSDIIELKPNKAYIDFLLPGLAVYDTPENRSKYNSVEAVAVKKSALEIERAVDYLSKMCIYIEMNKTQPWILEPWHLTATFRRYLVKVPEHTIEMPPYEIRGPDLSLEDKEFYVTLKINEQNKANVRCRIYHYDNAGENLKSYKDVCNKPHEPLFEEQAEVLSQMK